MIDPGHRLPITKQRKLLALNRSTAYYKPVGEGEQNLTLAPRPAQCARLTSCIWSVRREARARCGTHWPIVACAWVENESGV